MAFNKQPLPEGIPQSKPIHNLNPIGYYLTWLRDNCMYDVYCVRKKGFPGGKHCGVFSKKHGTGDYLDSSLVYCDEYIHATFVFK